MSPSTRTTSKSFLYLFSATFVMSPALAAPTATASSIPKECQCSASPLSSTALDYALRMAVARSLTPAECAFICHPSPPPNQESVLAVAPSRRQRMSHNRARTGRASSNLISHFGKDASPREANLLKSASSPAASSTSVESTIPTLVLTSIELGSSHPAHPEGASLSTAMDSPQPTPSTSLDLRPYDTNLLIPPLDPALPQISDQGFTPSDATSTLSESTLGTATPESSPLTSATSSINLLIPSPLPPPSAPSMISVPSPNHQQDSTPLISLSCPIRIISTLVFLFILAVLLVELLDTVRGFMGLVDRRRMSPMRRLIRGGKGKSLGGEWVSIRTKELSGEKADLEGGISGSESEGTEDGEWVRFGAGKPKKGEERVDGWC